MKNQKIVILLICLFTFQFYLFDCITINNEIDNKEIKISQINEINSSYNFNFNSKIEKIIIQIKVFDINNKITWFSNEFINIDKIDLKEINFNSLNDILKETNTYYLKVHKTYHHFESNNTQTSYIDSFTIKE